ncbi:MocR-like pyridoxine biosynthesis transcription factor PdxR [Peptoclostridium sp.]|uniref:MocR-like pyridoxine biosynthesis transcription factor PdxR n=1 Tax=Peptoclostridium sp. TaxID=1904860 RepID=UPI002ED40010
MNKTTSSGDDMEKMRLDFDEKEHKYIQVYKNIKKLILEKQLKKHEKLPPIRKYAQQIGVNNSTIVKAYELLESEGYVYKILGSGTYVSELNRFDENTVLEHREKVIGFHQGNPSSDIFPVEDFKKAIDMALKKEGASIFNYSEGLGYNNLRKKLCDYMKGIGIESHPDRIQIISGAQQGIDTICKSMVNYGDIVFVEEPTYNGALEAFRNKGSKIIGIPMLHDGIDIGILKLKLEKIRPKLIYVMPNFQNPTGISYSSKKKLQLLELAREYDFYIIEDDFISDFKFESEDNTTLRSHDKYDKVIYIKSFSKILMPGLRIGFMEVPLEILNRVIWAKYSSDISTSSLVQRALYYYMKYFKWDANLQTIENAYTERFAAAKEAIDGMLGDRLDYVMPKGGINFFLGLPKGYSAADFRDYMLEHGVLIMPGSYFYDNPMDDRFFRINIASTGIEEIKEGIGTIAERLDDFLEKYKNHIHFRNNEIFF